MMIHATEAELVQTPASDEMPTSLLVRQALERGLLKEAESVIEAMIAIDDEDDDPWLLCGVLRLLQARPSEACEAFAQALARGADRREARLGCAMALIATDRPADAWDVLSPLVAERPDDAEVLHWLLRAGCALDRWHDLVPALSRHLLQRPEDAAVRFALAGVYLRIGAKDAAQREYDVLRRGEADVQGLDELRDALTERKCA